MVSCLINEKDVKANHIRLFTIIDVASIDAHISFLLFLVTQKLFPLPTNLIFILTLHLINCPIIIS